MICARDLICGMALKCALQKFNVDSQVICSSVVTVQKFERRLKKNLWPFKLVFIDRRLAMSDGF